MNTPGRFCFELDFIDSKARVHSKSLRRQIDLDEMDRSNDTNFDVRSNHLYRSLRENQV